MIRRSSRSVWVFVLGLVLSAARAGAADWFVAADAGAGGDGSSGAPFSTIEDAMQQAAAGDRVFLGEGIYQQTVSLSVGGRARRALLRLRPGVAVIGAGRDRTRLRGEADAGAPLFGITAGPEVGPDTEVRALAIEGACFHGVNLRGASPTLRSIDVLNDASGSSSVGMDLRDGSAPLVEDLLVDGGHGAVFVEFGSSGRFERCRVRARPDDTLALSDATPLFRDCVFEGAGRDLLVLNLGSAPRFERCRFGRGQRWTVRVAAGYPAGSRVDLGGNAWFSADLEELAASVLDAVDLPSLGAIVVLEPLASAGSVGGTRWGGIKAAFAPRR